MTEFEKLFDALDLFVKGRKNAAKAQWESLSSEFRKRIMSYSIYLNQTKEDLSLSILAALDTKWGEFQLTEENLLLIKDFVPEIANG